MRFMTKEFKKLREEDVEKYKPLQKALKKVSSLGNLAALEHASYE